MDELGTRLPVTHLAAISVSSRPRCIKRGRDSSGRMTDHRSRRSAGGAGFVLMLTTFLVKWEELPSASLLAVVLDKRSTTAESPCCKTGHWPLRIRGGLTDITRYAKRLWLKQKQKRFYSRSERCDVWCERSADKARPIRGWGSKAQKCVKVMELYE